MATPKQIAANRANAKRSTGPKTLEGKAASSQNATRHGLLSATICLEAEDKQRFDALHASFTAQFEPRNPSEVALVEGLATARWHRMRLWAIQKANFEIEMAAIPDTAGSASVRAAFAFRKLADHSQTLQLLQRYDTAYERQFNRAFNVLTKLRSTDPTPIPPDFVPDLPLESGTFSDPDGGCPGPTQNCGPEPSVPIMPNTSQATASPETILRNEANLPSIQRNKRTKLAYGTRRLLPQFIRREYSSPKMHLRAYAGCAA